MNDEILNDADADATAEALRKEAAAIQKRLNLASVQIVATRLENVKEDGNSLTRRLSGGCGDHYARVGATRAWILQTEANEEQDEPEEDL